jgi:hypothetical protein
MPRKAPVEMNSSGKEEKKNDLANQEKKTEFYSYGRGEGRKGGTREIK